MVASQVSDPLYADERQRVRQLSLQDLDGSLDASLSCGHDTEQIRTPAQCSSGTECDGGHDVRPGHDAAVDVDLRTITDRIHDGWEDLERRRRAIQLTSAVVGHDDPVDAAFDHRAGI